MQRRRAARLKLGVGRVQREKGECTVIDVVADSLATITHPRFYETERGFQGEFLASLRRVLPSIGLPDDAVVEQEYQKRLREHGITGRPDIIIHVPTTADGNRRHHNFAIFELKLAARAAGAQEAFESLDRVLAALDYPIGVFINIATAETHADEYSGRFPERIHCFAVQLINARAHIRHAHFDGTRFVEAD
jgi:hypothetical protein